MAELTASEIRNLVGESPTIVEIGANSGEDTLKFLEVMPGAKIHCFEPDPRAIKRFEQNIQSNRIALYKAAVSDTDGLAVFHGSSGVAPREFVPNPPPACHLLDSWDLSGSLKKPTGHLTYSPWVTFPKENEYQVHTIRLDTWMLEDPVIPIIDFLWIDAQGGEADIFSGGQEALKKTRYCYFEFYDKPLYEGQLPLKELLLLLPGGITQWKLMRIFGDNALVQNVVIA